MAPNGAMQERFEAPERLKGEPPYVDLHSVEERGGGLGKVMEDGYLPPENRLMDVPEPRIQGPSSEEAIPVDSADDDGDTEEILEALPDDTESSVARPASTMGGGVGEIIDDEDENSEEELAA